MTRALLYLLPLLNLMGLAGLAVALLREVGK